MLCVLFLFLGLVVGDGRGRMSWDGRQGRQTHEAGRQGIVWMLSCLVALSRLTIF